MAWYISLLFEYTGFGELKSILERDSRIGNDFSDHFKFFTQLKVMIKTVIKRCSENKKGIGSTKTIETEVSALFPTIPKNLLYPSMVQLKEKTGEEKKYKIYLRSMVEKSLQIFASKDAPFMIKFLCSDGVERPLIFKGVGNSAQESIISNVFANAVYLQELSPEGPLADEFLGFHEKLALYNIQPIGKDIVIVEFLQGIQTVSDFIRRDAVNRSCSATQSKDREVEELTKNYFENMYWECDPYEWFNRKLLVNYSYGFWSMIGAIFWIGDRNLKNIMVGRNTGFLYIDFEVILGLSRNLPYPETVRMRLGPLFSRFPGIWNTKEVFKNVMVSYYSWVKENRKEFILQFNELLCHRGESAFSAKTEFFSEVPINESFVDFFLHADPDDYSQVTSMIEKEQHHYAQKHMFPGWEPTL